MTQEFVTLPREVVERALDALDAGVKISPNSVLHDRLRAALDKPQNHVFDAGNMVTAGWKLVPVEPTRDMLINWIKADVVSNRTAPDLYRAMLAAAPHPPYGYDQQALDLCPTCGWKTLIPGDCCLNCARQQPKGEQEPRFFYDEEDALLWTPGEAQYGPEGMTALYTHPQPKREPLTDEKITAATGAKPGTPTWLVAIAFARAVEAAHNIK